MASTVERLLPTDEARDLLGLTREIADAELAPAVTAAEHEGRFPEHNDLGVGSGIGERLTPIR